MIDAIWSDPGLYPDFGTGGTGANYTIGVGNDMYTMGDVVNQGLYAMEQNWNGSSGSFQYQYELFHWFGDPAMKIWTDNPNSSVITATHSSTIDCSGSSFAISGSTAGATATLVFNNELIGKTVLDASGNGSIPYSITSSGTSVELTISKHNHYAYTSTLTINGTCAFPPLVVTNTTTNVGETTATANGEITNDYGNSITESGVVYSLTPNPEINGSGVTKVQTSPLVTFGTFSVSLTGLSSNATYYTRAYAINANGTSYGDDDAFSTSAAPLVLPWTEDWEDITTSTFTDDVSGIPGASEWDYDEVDAYGRLRFEAGSGFYHGGSKAATLDVESSNHLNTNYLIAHLNLSNYSNATDMELSFYFMHHGEESHGNDRVWIRGSFTDSWIEIYDLYANKGSAGAWNTVSSLDVDATLAAASPPQAVSSTFQMRFGQEDNYPANNTTSSDGFTFDDIQLTGTHNPLAPVTDFNADNTTPSVGSTVYFTDLSANEPTSWSWSFSPSTVTYLNGTSASSQNPEVSFNASGLYSVQLEASNAQGNDTKLKTDYIDAYTCSYPASQASAGVISNLTTNSMTLSWTRGSGDHVMVVAREGNAVNPPPTDGTAYTANAAFASGSEIGTGNYVVYNGDGSSVNITGLNSGVSYYFAIYEYSSSNCYLLPACTESAETQSSSCSYCSSTYTDTSDDWITNVTLNTINNNSVQGGADSYEDFTAQQTDLQSGSSYSISISIEMSGTWTEHVWVWFDWNHDCDFTDTGEAYDLGDLTGTGTISSTISVPSEVLLGITTMRVIEQYNTDPTPCDTHPTNYGETEDYSVNVVPANVGWLGHSTNWNSPSNWGNDPAVPTPANDVTIPASPVGGKFPIINKNHNASCNKLTIEAGATLKVEGTLDVKK
jgi:PKD repeat protein